MRLIMQQDKPDDYVITTGEQHSVKEFCELAFEEVGIKIKWEGEGTSEKGIDEKTDEVDGFLCENENIEKMAEKIKYLIEEKEVRKSFGKRAKEHSSKYEIEQIMKQWIELLENNKFL